MRGLCSAVLESKQNHAPDPSHSFSQKYLLGMPQDLRYQAQKHWQEDLISLPFFRLGHWKELFQFHPIPVTLAIII